MNKMITPDIIVAYSQCSRKAYLLLFSSDKGHEHEYIETVKSNQSANRAIFLAQLQTDKLQPLQPSTNCLTEGVPLLANKTLRKGNLEAEIPLLSKVRRSSNLGRYSYEPTIFTGTFSVEQQHKLELFFTAHMLGQIQGRTPEEGRIVTMDRKQRKVKLGFLEEKLDPFLPSLIAWTKDPPSDPPSIMLNAACGLCQFSATCRAEAEKANHISLLQGLSPKAARKFEAKGIFTIEQMSYSFKRRKRKKRQPHQKLIFEPELQSLAIRTQKIFLQSVPQLKRHPVELFLDIEGVPDRHCYYLIGLLVCQLESKQYYPFWADSIRDEEHMWTKFLDKTAEFPGCPIYHYGSYESRAFESLAKRYGRRLENVNDRLVNLNSEIFGKIYFPVTSNSLKVLGGFIGASWTSSDASGLQSLVWRHRWETTHETSYQEKLVRYNREDCEAVRLLADEITRIQEYASSSADIDFADNPKQHATRIGSELHNQLDAILKLAHSDYDAKKIRLRSNGNPACDGAKRRGAQVGHPAHVRKIPRARTVVRVPRRRKCYRHQGEALRPMRDTAKQTVIDLVFTKTGVRKSVVMYTGTKSYCRKCDRSYTPRGIEKFNSRLFGHNFRAWVVYQRVSLRLPFRAIIQLIEDQFNETISKGTIVSFIKDFAQQYQRTEQRLMQCILAGQCVYVDETKINIQGQEYYVWVFTNGIQTLFKLTETRESLIVREMLDGFQGVLVSDFYAGYDSVLCCQQKCWSHLLRDLNKDLWNHPFDVELEAFVLELKDLIVPILQTVQRYGQKRRFLNKYQKGVKRFYRSRVYMECRSEIVAKYQKRFSRYKDSLFTFICRDGIGWNNNVAERALRHLAVQRKISGSFFESGAESYLMLLGIMQTCRFQGKSLLRFLLSGEKDVDQFKVTKSRRK